MIGHLILGKQKKPEEMTEFDESLTKEMVAAQLGQKESYNLHRKPDSNRHGEKSEEEYMESGNAKVEGGVGGVLIYTLSMPDVHFLTVSPVWVYCTSNERGVGCATTTTSHTEVDTGIVGQMN